MKEKERNEITMRDMLRYSPCPQMENVVRADNLDSWGVSREVGDFLLYDPNTLLFGAREEIGSRKQRIVSLS